MARRTQQRAGGLRLTPLQRVNTRNEVPKGWEMLRTAQVACTLPRVEADARRDKLWRAEPKRDVIDHESAGTYACSCCGESHLGFLVMDHIDGAVNNHRRSMNRSGLGFYRWLRANGYPPGFRMLCHNCHAAFGLHGACPHQAEKPVTAEMAWVPTGGAGRAQEAAPAKLGTRGCEAIHPNVRLAQARAVAPR